jgi:FkbM family methyltransferase
MHLKQIVDRFNLLKKRKKQARKLGFNFKRAAEFVLPSQIQIGSIYLNLSLPADNGTRTAFIDVLLDDCYFLREFPDDIQTVIDIGGHAGLFSIAARNRWPLAVIHTYEPNGALKENWGKHAKQANFSVYEEAVGEVAGKVSLIPNEDSVQVRTAETTDGLVRQIALRSAVARLGNTVDLVKLDCEGAEWKILRDKEAWMKVRFLTMEFHLWAGYTVDELRERVSDLGFQIMHLQLTGPDFGILSAYR